MSAAVGIAGVGLWTPSFASAAAWAARRPEAAPTSPRGDLLPAMQRRRASMLTRAALDAIAQAAVGAGGTALDLGQAAVVFGSAYGETAALAELLGQLHAPGSELSPTRFAASVHNACIGQLSIAVGQRGFATSVAAGEATLAMALLEAQVLLESGERDVVVAVADAEPPDFLSPLRFAPLAVALWLVGEPERAVAELGPVAQARLQARGADIPPELQLNPARHGLALVDAALGGERVAVPLAPGWSVDVAPLRRAR